MSEQGKILLADDEEVFGASTADLLRRQGYACDVVPDGDTALAAVGEGQYDLLISDLEMPGNEDLSLIRRVSERVGGLPVIILTGFPSTRSAIACIELPVVAYLVKPVAFDQLLGKVESAVARFRSYTAMRRTEERLREWNREVAAVSAPGAAGGPESVDAFLTLTLRNVMGSLTDLGELSRALANRQQGPHACQLVNCPRGLQLQEAVRETVNVLEETKGAFRSKTLANLRRQLEVLLDTN
ncbi:MAG: response regulator [Gemmatimonadales bacterium]